MGRSPCCSKEGLKRGPWSAKEDALLSNYILVNGEGQWRSLPTKAGLLRCGKSCRLRWMNYLRPGIKRGNISPDEEDLILRMHSLLGNRWSLIAGRLPGRTDNEIKNYWNTHLLKKLAHPAAADKSDQNKTKNQKQNQKPPAAAAEKLPVQVKTKVYSPKPIRVSPATTATSSSYESSSAAPEVASYDWPPPLFGGEEEDFLGDGGSILPLLQSISGDEMLLDRVYDEYLQLL